MRLRVRKVVVTGFGTFKLANRNPPIYISMQLYWHFDSTLKSNFLRCASLSPFDIWGLCSAGLQVHQLMWPSYSVVTSETLKKDLGRAGPNLEQILLLSCHTLFSMPQMSSPAIASSPKIMSSPHPLTKERKKSYVSFN